VSTQATRVRMTSSTTPEAYASSTG